MKISKINPVPYNNIKKEKTEENSKSGISADFQRNAYTIGVNFAAYQDIKKKNTNIDDEKRKLLRQINEILEVDKSEIREENTAAKKQQKELGRLRAKIKRKKEILLELQTIIDNKTMSNEQKYSRAQALKKELNLLNKKKIEKEQNPVVKKIDEKIDYRLVNKFKFSVSENEFNLRKVYDDYFSELRKIKTIDELKKKYPAIHAPETPEKVIAKKIENTLTRDFYEQLNKFFDEDQKDLMFMYSDGEVKSIVIQIAEKYNIEPQVLYDRIAPETFKAILDRFARAKMTKSFTSIPEFRKNALPNITDNDIKLLSVNFDDFVLYVVRKHYLDFEKLNNIVYSDGNTTVKAGLLKEPEYKFEKFPEKIKKIMSDANILLAKYRDYNNFSVEQFKARLQSYSNKEYAENEEILERIIAFDTCLFTKEDIEQLIKFLRLLDDIDDRKRNTNEVLNIIEKENIRPAGTEKIDELKQKNAEELFKKEQQKQFVLKKLKSDLNERINLLYANNLNEIANVCANYQPLEYSKDSIEKANFIMNTIDNAIDEETGQINNAALLESKIARYDAYNFYQNNDKENPVFIAAQKYAENEDGIDFVKAGKYIINAEIVESYPESKDIAKYPEVLSKVMDSLDDKNSAIEYLCKFDSYIDMNDSEKSKLKSFINLFNVKDSIEKIFLKFIIENEYVKVDTVLQTNVHENSGETVESKICTSAKQAIIDKYKFPTCIEYLEGFEEALSSYASEKGTSGIKKTTRNNKSAEYKKELKLMGHDDRLFSSNGDNCFDVFSEKGLH